MFRKLFGRRDFQVFVNDGNRQIDLYPIAEDVLKYAPEPCGMDALRLSELARDGFFGAYIRVSEYPPEINREYAKRVVGRVTKWARWQRKAESFRRTRFKKYQIETGPAPCAYMKKMSGKVIDKSKIERVPRNDCWQHCQCWYSLPRRK